MAGGLDFAGMVPGFDFLQGLMKGAGAAMPAMGQWVAPTLDPAELDKRIGELKTVQFWLEQNAKLLGTTIQAMEVQRMTLATLQTMNLPLADLRDALSIKAPPPPAPTPFSAFAMRPAPEPEPEPEPAPAPVAAAAAAASGAEPKPAATAAAVDPMQWWGALTQQFTEIASKAMQASAAELPTGAAPATPSPTPSRPRRTTPARPTAAKKAAGKKADAKARAGAAGPGTGKRRA